MKTLRIIGNNLIASMITEAAVHHQYERKGITAEMFFLLHWAYTEYVCDCQWLVTQLTIGVLYHVG